MHEILSTTGAPIEYKLTSEKVFIIDPVTPIEVSDEELLALQEKLGNQISSKPVQSEASAEEASEVEPTVEEATVEEASEVEPESVEETTEEEAA